MTVEDLHEAEEKQKADSDDFNGAHACFEALPICMVVFLVLIIIFMVVVGPTACLKVILAFLPKNPGTKHAILLGVVIVLAIVCFTPFWPPLMIVTAMVFGFWYGFAIIYVAMVLGAVISFLIARYFCRESFQDFINKSDNEGIRRMLRVVQAEDNTFKFMFFFRFMFMPIWARNYIPGLVKVPFLHFFIPVCVHAVMISLIFAFTGEATKDVAEVVEKGGSVSDSMDVKQFMIFGVSMVATLSLSYLSYREYSKKLAEEEEETIPLLPSQS